MPDRRTSESGVQREDPRTTRFLCDFSDSDTEHSGFQLLDDQPPEVVDAASRYKIVEEIGSGGMGVVYRATDLDLHRDVAIKFLLHEYLDRPKLAARFVEEARIMGGLQHPGIAQVYECGETPDGRPFHTMKLVEGKTLGAVLRERSHDAKPSERMARLLNIFAVACHAIAYTHSRNVVHLDLKPNNIMVGEFGEAHVMDWGLARRLSNQNSVTGDSEKTSRAEFSVSEMDVSWSQKSNHVHGTLEYMAPEQARGLPVDYRTDVFCLGGILYEILTGFPPYRGERPVDILRQARAADLSEVVYRLENCQAESSLVRLVANCLQENPDFRPKDASAIAQEMSHHSESMLSRAETDMTRFFELSLDLFCIAGFDGFFRRINCNFSKVLGYSERELLGRPFIDFVIEEDREDTRNVMGRLLAGQPVVRFRNRYRARNGELYEFEWMAKSVVEEKIIFAVARNVS